MSAGPEPPLSCDLRLNHAPAFQSMDTQLKALPTLLSSLGAFPAV